MFLKQVIRGRKTFYYFIDSFRDENGNPRQRVVEYLGNYEAACSLLENEKSIFSKQMLPKLISLELRALAKIIAMPTKKRGRPKLKSASNFEREKTANDTIPNPRRPPSPC
ncbi:hypothetical protein NIES2101_37375 [Calothrix sp. HK-06]|nr:hypothetical protein NIES2101_37375 [Calothrix sp. HK-06]